MGGDASVAPAKVTVRCSNGCKFPVEVSLGSTVGSFKELVASCSGIPSDQQRLIYKGRILKDDETLERYGVEYEHTIHLVRGSAPSSSNTTPRSDTGDQKSQSSTNAGKNARGIDSAEGGGLGGIGLDSFFPGAGILGMGGSAGLPGAGLPGAGLPGAGLPGAGLPGVGLPGVGLPGAGLPAAGLPGAGLPGAGLPDLDQIRQQLTQNPNMMRDMMNMPFIQNLLNNPDTLRNVITSSPQIREILDRNPELSHILNDPNTLRQAIEATRNPGFMREMMRNTDRAMSNIESSPEGFNMLRRMYETVQEPFLNATTMAGDVGAGSGLNSQSTDSSRNSTNTASDSTPSPNTNPLPNPWNHSAGARNNTRAPPLGDVRAHGVAGLGLPDFQGGMQDSSFFNQVLQNPAMSQMMQSLLSNPHYVNQIFSLNPAMRNMLENYPQLREMLQNPEFLRQLASPETLRQILTLQRSLSSLGHQRPGDQTQRGATGTGTLNSMGMDQLIQMFTNLGSSGLGVPIASNVPPEELYANQLDQLQEMGFFDTQENVRALVATAGNVHAAVERLLGNPGQ